MVTTTARLRYISMRADGIMGIMGMGRPVCRWRNKNLRTKSPVLKEFLLETSIFQVFKENYLESFKIRSRSESQSVPMRSCVLLLDLI